MTVYSLSANSSPRGSRAFFQVLQALGKCTVHIHICRQNVPIHKVIKINLKTFNELRQLSQCCSIKFLSAVFLAGEHLLVVVGPCKACHRPLGCYVSEWPYTSIYETKVPLQKEDPVIALPAWQACRHLVQKLTTCLQFTQQNPFDDRASGSVGRGDG